MLTIYRRHRAKCKCTSRRAKCFCPIWVQGILRGEEIRKSLDLTNWEAAATLVRDWEIEGHKDIPSVSVAKLYPQVLNRSTLIQDSNASVPQLTLIASLAASSPLMVTSATASSGDGGGGTPLSSFFDRIQRSGLAPSRVLGNHMFHRAQ